VGRDPVSYPRTPGWTEETTSREAAEAMEGRADTVRAEVLEALKTRPMTADEVAQALHESVLTVRPRVTELFQAGRIGRTGERRKNRSGRDAHVFRALAAAPPPPPPLLPPMPPMPDGPDQPDLFA
jgi:hypothetical protein